MNKIITMDQLYEEIKIKNHYWSSFIIDFIKGKATVFPEHDLLDIAEPEKCVSGELWNFKYPNCDDCLDFGTYLFRAYKNREPMSFAFLLVDLYDHMKRHRIKITKIDMNQAFKDFGQALNKVINDQVNNNQEEFEGVTKI